MTVYTQQANNIMERLPITEQKFFVELLKKISVNYSNNTNETSSKPVPLKQALSKFIDNISLITDEPLDEEFDEIVSNRINITRELDL